MARRSRIPVRFRIRVYTMALLAGIIVFVLAIVALRVGLILFGAVLFSLSAVALVRAKNAEKEVAAEAAAAERARRATTITVMESKPAGRPRRRPGERS